MAHEEGRRWQGPDAIEVILPNRGGGGGACGAGVDDSKVASQ